MARNQWRLGLVHEHVRPRGLLVAELIERARQLTVDALIDHLNAVMAGAVITKDEDAALLAAGVARKPLIAEDPDIWPGTGLLVSIPRRSPRWWPTSP